MRNKEVNKFADRVLVGGVNSPVRAFTCVGGKPIPIQRGRGSKIYDYDGRQYLDYVLSFGALILGHSRPEVIKGIKNAAGFGVGFGATNISEVVLAKRIQETIPLIKKIRFVSSGTEAVMGAIRLARGVTGKNKIIKFKGSYHGHADYLLKNAGSGLATLGLPASKGVPNDFIRHTLIARYGDAKQIDKIFARFGSDIAAVIVEPVGGNDGVILPDKTFLKYLRKQTKKFNALLIFDEVITGFRFHYGSAATYFGMQPDIICLGKIIGGGLPIGAYGASKKIMDHLAPLGGVYQASTFSGNPIVMKAGINTLKVLSSLKNNYKYTKKATAYLVQSISSEAYKHGIDLTIKHFASMFSIRFKNKDYFKIFHRQLLNKEIYLAPSEHESNFLSFAHTNKDIEKTISAVKNALIFLAKRKVKYGKCRL